MDGKDEETRKFLQKQSTFHNIHPHTTAQVDPSSAGSPSVTHQAHATPVLLRGGAAWPSPALPSSPATNWTPGPAGATELVAGFASQEQAEAMLAASATTPHDHLLLSPSTGSLVRSPHGLAFGSAPPPSTTQGPWSGGWGSPPSPPPPPCAVDPAVAQSSPFPPQETEGSPDRGEQSAPCPPTAKQRRREKRAEFVAAAGTQLGGGENRGEPSAEEKKGRQTEYCFVLTRATSQDEGNSGAQSQLPPNIARQLAFEGAPPAAAAAGTNAAAAAASASPLHPAPTADAAVAAEDEDYFEYEEVDPSEAAPVSSPTAATDAAQEAI